MLGDAEKPVVEGCECVPQEMAVVVLEVPIPPPQPSLRACLGQKAMARLQAGEAVDDELLVEIIVEYIRYGLMNE